MPAPRALQTDTLRTEVEKLNDEILEAAAEEQVDATAEGTQLEERLTNLREQVGGVQSAREAASSHAFNPKEGIGTYCVLIRVEEAFKGKSLF